MTVFLWVFGALVIVLALFGLLISFSKGNNPPSFPYHKKEERQPEEQKDKGERGEEMVNRFLLSFRKEDESVLFGFRFLLDGVSHEIDELYFSEKGIFIIETKSWKGRIRIEGNRFILYANGNKYDRGGLDQNDRHLSALILFMERNGIDVDEDVFLPVYVFVDGDISEIESQDILSLNEFPELYSSIDDYPDFQMVRDIASFLMDYQKKVPITKEEHIDNVRFHHQG